MDMPLRAELINAILRLKKFKSPVPMDIPLGELIILANIGSIMKEKGGIVYASEVTGTLPISKPAVSQILGNLEQRGYIRREIAQGDHRKVRVILTQDGSETLEEKITLLNGGLDQLILRMGETQIRQLTNLINQLVDVTNEMRMQEENL